MKWVTTILIFCVAVLIGLGLVMLYSSSMNMELGKSAVGASYLISQLTWAVIGLCACVLAASLDYRKLKKISPWLLAFSVLLLILVFVPHVGLARKGAHRWIGHSGLPHFQPSELAKLSLILFLAFYGDYFQRQMSQFKKGLLLPAGVVGVVLGLILVEPDYGCTILLAAVCGAMLIVAGVRLRFIVPPALAAVAGLVFMILHNPVRLARILAWLHPELHKDKAGYQAYEAMIAFGSGGWFGLGLGNGRQKLGGFVPERHTDFILPIIGEELGLIATLAVLVLFVVVVLCGTYIARHATDTFGLLLGAGLTFMIGLQALINIGVVTSILPNKGMPLPFISYGGSNLLLMMVSIGLLLSISRFATVEVKSQSSNPFEAAEEAHA